MKVLGVILARAGSKGLPDKCVRPLLGRPVIAYTFDHARAARRLAGSVLTTDSRPALALAREAGIEVVERPAELASDMATVDAAARHAVLTWETRHGREVDAVVLLYGNIPVRACGLIDRAVEHLFATGADSVRSVAPVSKQHPDWVHRLDGDRMVQFRTNSIYRRQDLEPLYYHDGAAVAVTREALFGAEPDDHQSFLGADRRAIVQAPEDAVDIDGPIDLCLAEAVLRSRTTRPQSSCGGMTPLFPPLVRGDGTGGGHTMNETSPAACDPQKPVASFVHLAGRRVGRGEPALVIAEAGVNHNGCIDTALRLVDAAVEAGADAVKFQVFTAAELACADAPVAPYQREGGDQVSQRDLLAGLELPIEAFRRIRDRCRQRGIQFLATPFSVRHVYEIADLGAPAVKIASTDLTNEPLLDAAISTGLPLLVSTGASTESEIRWAAARLVREARGRLILLHCVSCYPTPAEELNLRAVESLGRAFGVPCGLSDHTISLQVGALAVAAGACVLEKHFTLDRSQSGPDHAMSLGPDQLRTYIELVREAERALGDGRLGMREIERPVREASRRSITAATDIPAGAAIVPSMLTCKRPGTGIDPSSLRQIIGRTAKRHIPGDTMLSWEMLA